MTFLQSSQFNNLAINFESITVLSNSTTDFAISSGTVFQLGNSDQLHGSDSYSVSSGVITLPGSYYYLLKFVPAATSPVEDSSKTASFSYQFYDTVSSSYIGRRGWLIWQESPKLNGGDEYAIALVDASSSSKAIDCRVTTVNGSNIVGDPTGSQSSFVGLSRLEIFKWS
tara:strand:+ start:782 stop:1291 length:510 start_codon:yes stop_codon:yes gene_type:complete